VGNVYTILQQIYSEHKFHQNRPSFIELHYKKHFGLFFPRHTIYRLYYIKNNQPITQAKAHNYATQICSNNKSLLLFPAVTNCIE